MDMLLVVLGFTCIICGMMGSFLPVLPGPPLSWLGILLLYLTDAVPMNYWVLGISLAVTIVISILDYIIPAHGTKKFGGSRAGIWGTNIGLVVGLLAPVPFGFIVGPFLGAFAGELIHNSKDHKRAFRAAAGSLLGLMASAFMKFVVCVMFSGLFVWIVWENRATLFP